MMGYGAADEARVKQLSEKLSLNLDAYERVLAKQEFIGGNQFTLADLYHLPYGNLLFAIGLGNLLLDRPHVSLVGKDFIKTFMESCFRTTLTMNNLNILIINF